MRESNGVMGQQDMVVPVWFWRRFVYIIGPQIETVRLDFPRSAIHDPANQMAAVEGRATCAGSPSPKAAELCAKCFGEKVCLPRSRR